MIYGGLESLASFASRVRQSYYGLFVWRTLRVSLCVCLASFFIYDNK